MSRDDSWDPSWARLPEGWIPNPQGFPWISRNIAGTVEMSATFTLPTWVFAKPGRVEVFGSER